MTLKVIAMLFLLMAVLGLGFFLHAGSFPEPGLALEGDGNTVAVTQGRRGDENVAAAGIPHLPDLIVLLEELLADESDAAAHMLAELVPRDDVFGYLANLSLAERSRKAGNTPASYYRRALALHGTDTVRLELADWLAQNDQIEEAIAQYLLLVPSRDAMLALAGLDASPILVTRALVQGSHWQAAIDYLSGALENPELTLSARLELAAFLGESHARLGAYAEALPYLKRAYEGGIKNSGWWYARALEATGARADAASLYTDLGAAGAYRLGLMLNEEGNKEQAARTLAGSDNPAALWQGARIWEELGRPDRAVELYQQLAKGESRYLDAAAYRAYILMQRRGLPAAAEMLDILLDYPAWAVRLTGETRWEIKDYPEYATPGFIHRVEALQQSGRCEWAEIELAIGQAGAGITEMLALGEWYLQRGDYFRATRWGIRSLNTEKTRQGYLLAYQRPFEHIVLDAAASYGLDPHLVWAVMREESHFRPEAVSRVGAMGLMQVMPATGSEIARSKGVELGALDLLRPEVSIDFGAYYLRRMLDMFGGDLDKALAAYNGGPGNVRRWSASPLGTAPEDFPSVITFLETREYVAKVLNSYHSYNLLYGQQQ